MQNVLKIAALAALSFGLAAGPALADDMRAPHADYDRGYSGAPVGVNQYCPPGEVPHSYPNGNGVRCQTLDGYWR